MIFDYITSRIVGRSQIVDLHTADFYPEGYLVGFIKNMSGMINQKCNQVRDIDLGKVIVVSLGPSVINN